MNFQITALRRCRGPKPGAPLATMSCAAMALMVFSAQAAEINTGNPDFNVRWDNTVKYSAAFRVHEFDERVAQGRNNNLDDGDRNFRKQGLISNRGDIMSELDISFRKDFGVRVSGAAWYDEVYNRGNDNDSAASVNSTSVGAGSYTSATKVLHGKNIELLDAFAFGNFQLPGDRSLALRGGRYTQLYGETLYMGANGIAGTQGPIDIVKALSVPNSQFKEIGMPVGQTSFHLQLSPAWSIGAYYQFEWRPNRTPASGSYFSFADVLGAGAQRAYPPGNGPGGAYFHRGKDIDASNAGQGGMQVKWKATPNWEFGGYATNFHSKDPMFYARQGVNAGGAGAFGNDIGDYVQVYHQNTQAYGASFATVVGETNVSGEASFRHNQALASANGDFMVATGQNDNKFHTAYAVGNTLHANVSTITVLPASKLWEGANLISEVAYNRRISVSNHQALDPNSTRDAAAIRLTFEPSYFQIVPGVDLTMPMSLGYGLFGRSALGPFIFSPQGTGDFSIGLNADYEKTWKGGIQYTNFFGRKGGLTDDPSSGARTYSYAQQFWDRDFISAYVSRTF